LLFRRPWQHSVGTAISVGPSTVVFSSIGILPRRLLLLIEPCFIKFQGANDSSNAYALIVVKRCPSRVQMDVIRSSVDSGPLPAHTGLRFRLTRGSCISSYNPGFSSHKTECAPLGLVVDL
jgi:hypothetical protein